jgi:hypothetical protein
MKHLTCMITIAFILLGCGNRNSRSFINVPKEITVKDTSSRKNVNHLNQNKIEIDTNNIILSEFIVVSADFDYLLDSSIVEYNKCEKLEKGYHFTISIGDAKIKERSGMKSLYICRSYYKDFVSRGYGFFYYRDYLFVLEGQQLEDIFWKTNGTKKFLYKQEPVSIFDPPRWLYYFWNKEFYLADSAPCGG